LININLEQYDNKWYKPGSKIKIFLWMLTSILIFRTSIPIPSFIKAFILRVFGSKVGTGVVIKPNVNIKYPWKLCIGNNTWIGEDVWIDNLGFVFIGDNCCLSQGCYLLTGNHDFTSEYFNLLVSDINIKNEAWIGAMSIVCPGINCERGSVLTVGSIATKNLESFSIYQGNPAIKIKDRILKY
jgi:putative colanic acid biosynthesis acetyltransferase WcaF